MLRTDATSHMMAPPPRDTLPTLPCDLAEYAQRETGPRSWSAATAEDLGAMTLDDPFDDLFSDEEWRTDGSAE